MLFDDPEAFASQLLGLIRGKFRRVLCAGPRLQIFNLALSLQFCRGSNGKITNSETLRKRFCLTFNEINLAVELSFNTAATQKKDVFFAVQILHKTLQLDWSYGRSVSKLIMPGGKTFFNGKSWMRQKNAKQLKRDGKTEREVTFIGYVGIRFGLCTIQMFQWGNNLDNRFHSGEHYKEIS